MKFQKMLDFLKRNPPPESNEDKHEFLVEIASNPKSLMKTPQTWLESFQKDCFIFVKNFLKMWRNKGFISSDLCVAFDCEAENKIFFEEFSKNLLDKRFTQLLRSEYFLEWKKVKISYLKKMRRNGLRRSVKNFVNLNRDLHHLMARSFYCKIKRFQEEAHQNMNSAIERGQEEGLFDQDQVLKSNLMKIGFPNKYVHFLENKESLDERYWI
jgi:hypothetical protein